MEQHNMISEEELRDDLFLKNIIAKEIPNEKLTVDFTQKVMKRVAVLPVPAKKNPWYQSLSFWIIITSIAFVFVAGFGFLFYLCDFSIMQTFSVIINYLNKFELEIPLQLIFSGFNFTNTAVIVITLLGVFVLIDFMLTRSLKHQRKKTTH